MENNDAVIIIPSRISSTRLKRKPLQKIGDKTVIEWVANQAIKVNLCDVVVACCCDEIAEVLRAANIPYVLTDPNSPSGSDRVYEAYKKLGKNYDYIINLQGDMPFVKCETIKAVYHSIKNKNVDIATPATRVEDNSQLKNLSVVEAITSKDGRALYFTRYYDERKGWLLLEHIGIYAYTLESLARFSSLPESMLEKLEKLEQLRALENGMSIHVCEVDDPHISVDTPEDLINAKSYYEKIVSKS